MRHRPRHAPQTFRSTAPVTALRCLLAFALMLFVVMPHLSVMASPAAAIVMDHAQASPCHALADSGDEARGGDGAPRSDKMPCCTWTCGWLGPAAATMDALPRRTGPRPSTIRPERRHGIAVEPGERPPRPVPAISVATTLHSPGAL